MDPPPPPPLPGARLLFGLDPAVAYLNHGSLGAVPLPVQRAQQRLRDEMDSNPVRFFERGLDDRIGHTRRHLAGFLGADGEGSALVPNVSAGVALVLRSLDLQPQDEIITTDHGYGAVALAVRRACQDADAVHRLVALPLRPGAETVVGAVRAAVTSRTRLVIVDQITSATALVLPVANIIAALRSTDVAVLVDGAHAPGVLERPAGGIEPDFWVGNLHKWAYAPRGTAVLAVSPPWRGRIRPLVVSWRQDAGYPASVESQGTLDYTPWLAAPAGLHVLRTLGVDLVRQHNARLARFGQHVVGQALGVADEDLPGVTDGTPLPMRIVPLPPGSASDADAAAALRRRIADELRTEVAVNPWHGRGLLRLSAQVYNRPEEYERLAEDLPGLLRPG